MSVDTEIKDPEAASKGYFLGAELLNFLAPDSSQETLTVPISTEITERRKKGWCTRPRHYCETD